LSVVGVLVRLEQLESELDETVLLVLAQSARV
jgi:hypothetical protein